MFSERARSAPPALAAGLSNNVTTIGGAAIALHFSSAPNTPPADYNPHDFLPTHIIVDFPTATQVAPAPVAATATATASTPLTLSGTATTAAIVAASRPVLRRSTRCPWSEADEAALGEAVMACWRRASHRGGEDQGLWDRVEVYMKNVKGIERSSTACRIKWGRDCRKQSGFDERKQNRVRNPQLQTSSQKRPKRSRPNREQTLNANEGDSNSPPKKARKQESTKRSSARKAAAANSLVTSSPPANVLRPSAIYHDAVAPFVASEPTKRAQTIEPPFTYSAAHEIPRLPDIYNYQTIQFVAPEPASNISPSSLGVSSIPDPEHHWVPDAFNIELDSSSLPDPANNAQLPDLGVFSLSNSELHWTPDAFDFESNNSSIPEPTNNILHPDLGISSIPASKVSWIPDDANPESSNSSVPELVNNIPPSDLEVPIFPASELYWTPSAVNLDFSNSVPGPPASLDNLYLETSNTQVPEQPKIPSTPSQPTDYSNELYHTESVPISLNCPPQNDFPILRIDYLECWYGQDCPPDPSQPLEWFPSDEIRHLLTEEEWYYGL